MGFELVLELHKARPRQGWRLLAPLPQTDAAGVRAWTVTLLPSVQSAFEALLARKLRSALTLLGVLIGVAGVLIIDSVAQVQNASAGGQLQRLGSNLVSVSPAAPTARGLANAPGAGTGLRPGDAASVRQVPHVVAVSPEMSGSQQVANGRRSARTTVTAATPDIEQIQSLTVRIGAMYTARHERAAAPVALLGQTVVDRLFAGDANPVGQHIRIHNADFTVIGVLVAKGNNGGGDLDDVILVPFTTGQQRLYGTTQIGLLQLQVDSSENIPAVIAALTTTLERSHRVRPGQADDFRIRSYQQLLDQSQPQMALITTIMRGIALAALAMGGFGLMNILLLGVTERTMELGVRLAVGARQVDLLVQFLVEAVTLALVGGMLGVGIGLGATPVVPLILGGRASYPAPPSLSAIAAALGLTVAIGLVFGTYPALRASRLDPVAALRSE